MSRRRPLQTSDVAEKTDRIPSHDNTVDSTETKKINKRIRQKDLMVRIRAGAGINYQHVNNEFLGKGIFEIDDITPGVGSMSGWGHLANGKGWVALDFVEILD